MKWKINYFENEICMEDGHINVLEIENKSYFYRFIQDLSRISEGDTLEEITFYDENFKEINLENKIMIIVDYFHFDVIFKRYLTGLLKLIEQNIKEEERFEFTKLYKKISALFNKCLIKIDIPIIMENELDIMQLIKLMRFSIPSKNSIFENLLLMIDIEKNLKTNQILVLINLKQYLLKEEILELYKYSIYNGVKIVLIDSQNYGTTLDYEKKIIIDNDLYEIMIQ